MEDYIPRLKADNVELFKGMGCLPNPWLADIARELDAAIQKSEWARGRFSSVTADAQIIIENANKIPPLLNQMVEWLDASENPLRVRRGIQNSDAVAEYVFGKTYLDAMSAAKAYTVSCKQFMQALQHEHEKALSGNGFVAGETAYFNELVRIGLYYGILTIGLR